MGIPSQLRSLADELRRIADAAHEVRADHGRDATAPEQIGHARDALVFDVALRQARIRALIHSQYPITSDFDRGYDKGRKDAADAIDTFRTRGVSFIQQQMERGTEQSVLVNANVLRDIVAGTDLFDQEPESQRRNRYLRALREVRILLDSHLQSGASEDAAA
jgi:hypothetical protein